MGWTFGWQSRKELIDHLTKEWEDDYSKTTCLAKYLSGNDMWCVFERASKPQFPGSPVETHRFIALFLIRGGKNCTEGRGYGWGYKDMDECMGPYTYTCPLKFLDMVPIPDCEYAAKWRDEVRKHHARVGQKLVVGQVVKLTNGHEYKIISLKPLRGTLAGLIYRIPRSMLTFKLAEELTAFDKGVAQGLEAARHEPGLNAAAQGKDSIGE